MASPDEFVFDEEYGKDVSSPVLFNLYSEYMMKEFDDEVKEIVIGGRNFNNLRYTDDAVYLCCSKVELQEIITRLAEVCTD